MQVRQGSKKAETFEVGLHEVLCVQYSEEKERNAVTTYVGSEPVFSGTVTSSPRYRGIQISSGYFVTVTNGNSLHYCNCNGTKHVRYTKN